MVRIAVVGSGYVGLVTGACLSDFGLNVICVDNDDNKIAKLKNGIIPIYEPGLDELVLKNVQNRRLEFTTDMKYAVENSDVIFIAVGTPPLEDGNVNLQYVKEVASDIAKYMNGYKIVVDKSTVPVGTGKKVKEYIRKKLLEAGKSYEFDVVSNPEFLREGNAIYDFTHPDRVVIGAETEKAFDIMKKVYRVLYLNETPFILTGIETAELAKYANNAFLALKISFINEVANLCEKVGANVQDVAKVLGRDGRIGPKFLHAGPGYGGSCFPKDTMALTHIGRQAGSPMQLIETVIKVNNEQKLKAVEKIESVMQGVKGKTFAILGLTYKPRTDDMREAPSITIIKELVKRGGLIRAFDPVGIEQAKKAMRNIKNIEYLGDEYSTVDGCNALIIVTEWHQFGNLNLYRIKKLLKEPYFFDLRNIYDKKDMLNMGFKYYGTGV